LNLQPKKKALCCLPLNYIAGKMMVVRALVLGLDLYLTKPSKNPLKAFSFNFDFVAFTPYQLEHSLKQLNKIKTLIVGGSPISEKTKKLLYKHKTDVYETFGMTETVSHIALKHISQGKKEFKAIEGVRFETENNCLKIFCDSILKTPLLTNDIVDLISEKKFVWKARTDFVINSGAIKIFPELLEKKLSQVFFVPFIIFGFPDEKLGEKISIVFEGKVPYNFEKLIKTLSSFERPKKVFNLKVFPRNNNKLLRKKIINEILNAHEPN
jgi:O-succinylbenzoic acid--CoA ligase